MMCKNCRVIQILVLASGLFLCRVPVLADTKTYTTTADFDEGIYIRI